MSLQVKDVMTRAVISVTPSQSVQEAVALMLKNRISGLPVVDRSGNLVGIVSEGDFLRRGEIGTQRRRPKWLEFLVGPGRLADEYVHAAGSKIDEVMTPEPYTVTETDTVETVVGLMERRHIKRLPVVRDKKVVGIVTRANLMAALAEATRTPRGGPAPDDLTIRDRIIEAFAAAPWAPRINVTVQDGVVELSGIITDERERQAAIVATENINGVRLVHDHLVWVEPMSGTVFPSPEDEDAARKSPQH